MRESTECSWKCARISFQSARGGGGGREAGGAVKGERRQSGSVERRRGERRARTPCGHVDALLLGGLGDLGLVHERGHLVQRQLGHGAHVLGDEVGDRRDLGRQRAPDARDARDRKGALVALAHDARADRHAVVARRGRARDAALADGATAAKGRARHVEARRAPDAVVVAAVVVAAVVVVVVVVVVVLARALPAPLAAAAAVLLGVAVAAHARRARAAVQVGAAADLELHHRNRAEHAVRAVLVGRAGAAPGAGRRGPHGVLRRVHARRLRQVVRAHGLALGVWGHGAVVVAVGHWRLLLPTRVQFWTRMRMHHLAVGNAVRLGEDVAGGDDARGSASRQRPFALLRGVSEAAIMVRVLDPGR